MWFSTAKKKYVPNWKGIWLMLLMMAMAMANEHHFALCIFSRNIHQFSFVAYSYIARTMPSTARMLIVNQSRLVEFFVKLSFHRYLMHSLCACICISMRAYSRCCVQCNQPQRQLNTSFGFKISSFCNAL